MSAGTTMSAYDTSGAGAGRTYWEYIEEIADFAAVLPLGDGLAKVRRCIDDGYQMFLHPPTLEREKVPHRWSFLSPHATLTLVADTYEYNLPADFGTLTSDFTYAENSGLPPITRSISESEIRHRRETTDANGDPTACALVTAPFAAVSGQRAKVLFWPTSTTGRTLTYTYSVLVNRMAVPLSSGSADFDTTDEDYDSITDATATFDTNGAAAGGYVIVSDTTANAADGIYRIASVESETKIQLDLATAVALDYACTYEVFDETVYALGGRAHSNVLLQCCRAIADQRFNDTLGDEYQLALKLLADAVRDDRRNAPDFITRKGGGLGHGSRVVIPVRYE